MKSGVLPSCLNHHRPAPPTPHRENAWPWPDRAPVRKRLAGGRRSNADTRFEEWRRRARTNSNDSGPPYWAELDDDL